MKSFVLLKMEKSAFEILTKILCEYSPCSESATLAMHYSDRVWHLKGYELGPIFMNPQTIVIFLKCKFQKQTSRAISLKLQ